MTLCPTPCRTSLLSFTCTYEEVNINTDIIDATFPLRDRTQGDPRSFTSTDGDVRLVVDVDSFDFHMDVRVGADPKTICAVYTQVQWWGMEALDDSEDPGSVYDDERGTWVRRYLSPRYPDQATSTTIVDTLMILALFILANHAVTMIPSVSTAAA